MKCVRAGQNRRTLTWQGHYEPVARLFQRPDPVSLYQSAATLVAVPKVTLAALLRQMYSATNTRTT